MNLKLISAALGSIALVFIMALAYIQGRNSREGEVQQYKQQLVLLSQAAAKAKTDQNRIEESYKKSIADLRKSEKELVAKLSGLSCDRLLRSVRDWAKKENK